MLNDFLIIEGEFLRCYSKNDHQYYNVSYVVPKSEGMPLYYVEDHQQFIRIDALQDQHRSAAVNE